MRLLKTSQLRFVYSANLYQFITQCCKFTTKQEMDLTTVLQALETLAPLKLAATWDNVGLLVQPSVPMTVKKIMLTNDLTENVLEETISAHADMIISYHPPIFRPLTRLTMKDWKERLIVKSLENRIAIYSPHTACDAVNKGVNDWLALGLGELESIAPISYSEYKLHLNKLVTFNVQPVKYSALLEDLREQFVAIQESQQSATIRNIQLQCSDNHINEILEIFGKHGLSPTNMRVLELCKLPCINTGMGRICHLVHSATIDTVIKRIKTHLSLSHVRLALGRKQSVSSEIQSIALCAGSGASVLQGVKADLYLTGEMSHHEVLDANSRNTSVVLCEHSNTERGYLNKFKEMLHCELQNTGNEMPVQILISLKDKDPLEFY